MTTDEDYAKYMQTIAEHDGSIFMQVRFDHVRFLNGDGSAAVTLSYILNLLRMKNLNDKDREWLKQNDLWMKCPSNIVQKKLGMSQERLQTALTNLKNKELVATCYRAGNQLWVRVDVETLNTIVKQPKPETDFPGNREQRDPVTASTETENSGIPCENKQEKKPSVAKQRRDPIGGLLPGKSHEEILTNKLYRIIEIHGRLRPKPKSLVPWRNAFSGLLKTGYSYQLIDASLNWYNRWFDKDNIPQKYSAVTYCSNFQQILNGMKRTEEEFIEERETRKTERIENGKKIISVKLPEYDE